MSRVDKNRIERYLEVESTSLMIFRRYTGNHNPLQKDMFVQDDFCRHGRHLKADVKINAKLR